MRFAWLCILGVSLLGGLSGCGGVTEKEKEAAEKVPSLEIGEGDNTTSDSTKPETKENTEGEAAKPK